MKLQTTFRIYKNDEAPYYGAYRTGSLNEGQPELFLNIEALIEAVKDEDQKATVFQDIVLSTTVHEFAHAMQEWLGKEYDELEVEKILGSYNEKWNVFNAEKSDDEDDGMVFKIEDLLIQLDSMNDVDGKTDEYAAGYYAFKKDIQDLFKPMLLWYEAEKKNKAEKEKINEDDIWLNAGDKKPDLLEPIFIKVNKGSSIFEAKYMQQDDEYFFQFDAPDGWRRLYKEDFDLIEWRKQ